MNKEINEGDIFGSLTAVKEVKSKGTRHWLCQCSCGRGEPHLVRANKLRSGETLGCKHCPLKHGHSSVNSKTYRSWCAMLQRIRGTISTTSDPFYKDRGVLVCDRWNPDKGGSFENFLDDMGERPEGTTLDKDIKGGIGCLIYSKDTCRWATPKEQANHTRRCRLYEYKGKVQSLKMWAEEFQINYGSLYYRVITSGWDIAKALTQPIGLNYVGASK